MPMTWILFAESPVIASWVEGIRFTERYDNNRWFWWWYDYCGRRYYDWPGRLHIRCARSTTFFAKLFGIHKNPLSRFVELVNRSSGFILLRHLRCPANEFFRCAPGYPAGRIFCTWHPYPSMVRIISPATIMVDNLSPSAGIIKIPSLIFRPGPKAGWVGVPTRRGDGGLPHFTIFGMLNELSGGTESSPPIVRDGRDRISGGGCILLVAYIRWWWRRIRTATWGRCGLTTVILRLGAV
jgi:hypothetical protein